jgi:hypothetical protein
MAELTSEDLRMRQFLLDELGEDEREELEQLVLTEDGARDKLLMAEDDLIEEYLEGSLRGKERERFLRQFLSIPHQRNKLRIAKSLRRFARDESNIETVPIKPRVRNEAEIDTVPIMPRVVREAEIDTLPIIPLPKVPTQSHAWSFHSLLVYAPFVAVIVVAIAVGAIWYAKYRDSIERENQRQAVERELVQLNAPEGQNLPTEQVSTLTVPPFSPRSVIASSSSSFKGPILELRLLPGTQQAERYNAVLNKVGSTDKFLVPNLKLHDQDGDKAVHLRIPTRLLTPGVYAVQLNGLATDGSIKNSSEYSFEIQ